MPAVVATHFCARLSVCSSGLWLPKSGLMLPVKVFCGSSAQHVHTSASETETTKKGVEGEPNKKEEGTSQSRVRIQNMRVRARVIQTDPL